MIRPQYCVVGRLSPGFYVTDRRANVHRVAICGKREKYFPMYMHMSKVKRDKIVHVRN
jgi:hypothetical protein